MSNLTRQMHSDGKKRRSFLALLFSAGDLQRSVAARGLAACGDDRMENIWRKQLLKYRKWIALQKRI